METEEIEIRPLKVQAKVGLRISEVWEGANRFYCNGKFVAGPISDVSAQTGVAICYFVALGTYTWIFGPVIGDELSWIFPLITEALFLGVFVSYLLVHLTDPGIIPRKDYILAGLTSRSASQCTHLCPIDEGDSELFTVPNSHNEENSKSVSSKLVN